MDLANVKIQPLTSLTFPCQLSYLTFHFHISGLNMSRIYPECQTLTATGRVSLHEPSIQNVPRDFEVVATPQLLKKALGNVQYT